MAAWPRNVVKEHRCAAWLLYLFLISLFITYASYTINHNLQRRDEPVVVEDIREEAWTLPDITACIEYTDGLNELKRYNCYDNDDGATCEATAHIVSLDNESKSGKGQFCVWFKTSTLAPRARGDSTFLEFTWDEVNPFHVTDYFPVDDDDGELREATVAMSGYDDFFAESTNYYYLPISTTAVDIGSSNDMSPAKEVHRRLGHPYSLPPPPTTDEIGFKATFTTSPLLNYEGNSSQTRFANCYGYDSGSYDSDSRGGLYISGCPGQPIFYSDEDESPFVTGYFQLYIGIHSLETRYYIEQDPMEPLKLWGILAGTFTQVGMLFGLCFIGKAHLRARFSGKAAEAVGERSSRLGARLSSTPAVTRLRTRSASLGARLSTVARFPGSKASRSEDSDTDASAAVELGEVTNPVSSPEPLGRGEPEGIDVFAPPRASGLL